MPPLLVRPSPAPASGFPAVCHYVLPGQPPPAHIISFSRCVFIYVLPVITHCSSWCSVFEPFPLISRPLVSLALKIKAPSSSRLPVLLSLGYFTSPFIALHTSLITL